MQCTHINDARINKHDKKNNNCPERFNSTQRRFYRPRRGIRRVDSYLFYMFVVYYNYVRNPSAIGSTPAKAAGVIIHGADTRKTLIENTCVEAWRGA